jgi:hypothetical protein
VLPQYLQKLTQIQCIGLRRKGVPAGRGVDHLRLPNATSPALGLIAWPGHKPTAGPASAFPRARTAWQKRIPAEARLSPASNPVRPNPWVTYGENWGRCLKTVQPSWPQFCTLTRQGPRTAKVGQPVKAGMLAQRARIESEARKLAHSGDHSGWRSIERALLSRSLTQVPYVFANAWTRSELDRLCRQARLLRKDRA